jgi:PEP-CTERM motif
MTTLIRPLSKILAGACVLLASAAFCDAQLAFNNVTLPPDPFSAFSTSSSPNTFMGDAYTLGAGATSITGFDIYPVNVSGTSFTGLKINIFVWGSVNTSGTVNSTTPAFGNLLATYTLTSAGNFSTGFYFPFESATPGVTPGISLATPLNVPGTVGISFNYQGTTDGVNYSSFQNLTSIISSNAPTVGSEVFAGYYRNAGTPTETDGNFTSSLRALGGLGNFQSLALRIYTVPEPTSLALAGLGAAALVVFRRRK